MDPLVLKEILPNVVAVFGVATALYGFVVALRSGMLRRIKFGAFEIEASPRDTQEAKALINVVTRTDSEPIPYETEQLAQYYSQVLAQSKVSFWFSLVFASLGFAVIVAAGFLYSSSTSGATVAQFIAGVIMDAVSALFFVQSKNAQTAMGEFFDKLRRDRQQAESRKLCESITDPRAKDALRIQLALHYADIPKTDDIFRSIANCLASSSGPNEVA